MRRDPLVDPPEYVMWQPDAASVDAWDATIASTPARAARIAAMDDALHVRLYADLLRTRLADQILARWVRQGRLSKAWLGTGEEATTIGPVHALDPSRDHLLPVIRNQGAMAIWGLPQEEIFRSALGTPSSMSAGRDLHAGDPKRRCWTPVSQMGAMVPIATGLAMAEQRRGTGAVVLTWLGDGAASTTPAHEGLNLAGVQRVPLVVIVQNNGVALGTPTTGQHAAADFRDWPAMYGLTDGGAFDGNHVLDAWAATAAAVEQARQGVGPVLLEARTFRFGGHATHDDAQARALFPREVWEAWAKREPIGCYETWLLLRRNIAVTSLEAIEARVRAAVEAAAERALQEQELVHDPSAAMRGVHHGGHDARRAANIRASGRMP